MELKDFRKAAARLFYDMINADGVIEDNEILLLEGLIGVNNQEEALSNGDFSSQFPKEAFNIIKEGGLKKRYGIRYEDIYAANQISTAEAIKLLKDWKDKEENTPQYRNSKFKANNILIDLETISGCDNNRDINEAKLLAALSLTLQAGAIPIKYKERKLRFAKKEIIYLETEFNEDVHQDIIEHKKQMECQLAIYGYEFIYLPDTIDFLSKKANMQLLGPILMFSKPTNFRDGIEAQKFEADIRSITTAQFTQDFVKEAGLVEELPPSFLLKVKTTTILELNDEGDVVPVKYTDFIAVPVKNNIVDALSSIPQTILTFAKTITSLVERQIEEKLYCKGIHKTLIDYAVEQSGTVNKVVINIWGKTNGVLFCGIGESMKQIRASSLAIYVMLCVYILKDRENHGLLLSKIGGKEVDAVYQKIYQLITGKSCKSGLPDWSVHRSFLRGKIKEILSLPSKANYYPEDIDGVCKLRINPALIYVRTTQDETDDIPLSVWIEQNNL